MHMNIEDEDEYANPFEEGEQTHVLETGDICFVNEGRNKGKTVLVLKPSITTKKGDTLSISVEYPVAEGGNPEKVWCEPNHLMFVHKSDTQAARRINDADYEEWKARKAAGVPPSSQLKKKNSWGNKRNY